MTAGTTTTGSMWSGALAPAVGLAGRESPLATS
uniref:Uncharacterized protein n=1 Tax=Arundo donax TaxID=35708 RepID=A0A0A9BV08_ARUDO